MNMNILCPKQRKKWKKRSILSYLNFIFAVIFRPVGWMVWQSYCGRGYWYVITLSRCFNTDLFMLLWSFLNLTTITVYISSSFGNLGDCFLYNNWLSRFCSCLHWIYNDLQSKNMKPNRLQLFITLYILVVSLRMHSDHVITFPYFNLWLESQDTQSSDAPSKILNMSGNSEIMPNGIPALLRTYHINIKVIHALSGHTRIYWVL